MKSYHLMLDYESFSSLILDEIFKNKSLLSWDELDAAICRHNLDKVSMMEPANVFRNSATDARQIHFESIPGTSPWNVAVGHSYHPRKCFAVVCGMKLLLREHDG